MKRFKILSAILIFAIMSSFILSKTTCAAEEKNYIRIQHLVFQIDETAIPKDKNAAIELNNKLFGRLQEKFDILGIPKVQLLPFNEKNIFVISYTGENTPEEIINAIQPEKLPIPLKLLCSFNNDFALK